MATNDLTSFYVSDGSGQYVATPRTQGPWEEGYQHGGPPVALIAGEMLRNERVDGFSLARLTFEFLRPVPITTVRVVISVRRGQTARRLDATMFANGRAVVGAVGLFLKNASCTSSAPEAPSWDSPASASEFSFPFFRSAEGYHRAVALRLVSGEWGSTPIAFWARPLVDLVAERPLHPVERLLILADAQSGMGVPLDPNAFTFVNPDLTVYFERTPVGPWLGFDVRSTSNEQGLGLSQSAIRDEHGICARSCQSLLVRRRG